VFLPGSRTRPADDEKHTMSDDRLPASRFALESPFWMPASRTLIEAEGLAASLPSLMTNDGVEYVPVFNDRDGARRAIDVEPSFLGHFPLKIDTPGMLAAILRRFEENGLSDVGLDPRCGEHRFPLFKIAEVINYLERPR
jgi:hypothetical protein